VANSDAHTAVRIGDIPEPLKFIEQYNIPIERVKNINQMLKIKKINN